jgi:hypothetical protein
VCACASVCVVWARARVCVCDRGGTQTNHMLFIASGAFHSVKPSDLMPELQGRLPVRVQLQGLTQKDLLTILTDPKCSLTKQYEAMMATEGVELKFLEEGLEEVVRWGVPVIGEPSQFACVSLFGWCGVHACVWWGVNSCCRCPRRASPRR